MARPEATRRGVYGAPKGIRDLETEVELHIELSDFERSRRLRPTLDRSFAHLCGMVALVMHGDIHRQATRLKERQVHKTMSIDIDANELPDKLRDAAPIWIERLLKELASLAGSMEDSHSEVEAS